jgi:hydrogenase/urease accessory protein HupE
VTRLVALLIAVVALAWPCTASAHPLNPALLEVRELGGGKCDVNWRTAVGGAASTPFQPVLPPDCKPIGEPVQALLQSGQSVKSHWQIQSERRELAGSTLGVTGLEERRTEALLRVELADGRALSTVLRAGQSTFEVPRRPSALDVARSYGKTGIIHILSGPDHLLFVFGLMMLVSGRKRLFLTITSFTAGHTVTLSLAALGVVRIPPRPVEVLIAASIFVLGLELVRPPEQRRLGERPWWMAGAFGLLHGVGFAGALAEVGLPPGEIPAALVSFNAGIEVGQLMFVGALLALWRLWRLFPARVTAPFGPRLCAYAIGALSTLWIYERIWV